MRLAAEILDSLGLHDPHEPIAFDTSHFEFEGLHDPHELKLLRLDAAVERVRVYRAGGMIRSSSTHRHRTSIEVVNVAGKPTLQQSRELANSDWIGWQYRGSEWRQFVRTPHHSGSSPVDRQRREMYVQNHYSPWFEELLGLDTVMWHESSPNAGGYTITDPDLVARSRKLVALSVADVVRVADHLISFSYERFGG
jgi:hypothetical protein